MRTLVRSQSSVVSGQLLVGCSSSVVSSGIRRGAEE
jgi:hypothetical protein